MKYLFLFILILISFGVKAQVYKLSVNYGTIRKCPIVDTTLKLESVCGTPKSSPKHEYILYDSCNKKILVYNLEEKKWLSLPK